MGSKSIMPNQTNMSKHLTQLTTFLLLLLLNISLTSSFTRSVPDPCCITGITNNNICCLKSCGQCGGAECDGFPGGDTNCCPDTITSLGVQSCNNNGPPCMITARCETLQNPLAGNRYTDGSNYDRHTQSFPYHSYYDDTNSNGKNGQDTEEDIISPEDLGYSHMYARQVLIEVTACDGWHYGSISNSLQIQLKGQKDSSKFFFVNRHTSLPTYGHSYIYSGVLYYYSIWGNLFSILLSMDDYFGYCLKGISVLILPRFDDDSNKIFDNIDVDATQGTFDDLFPHLTNKTTTTTLSPNGNVLDPEDYGRYNFYEDYFGMGVFLSKKCRWTHMSFGPHRVMPRCYHDGFELYVPAPRGIFKLVAHTCIHPDSGMDALDQVGNVYNSIMGKPLGENVYQSTDFEYMDHAQVGDLQLDQLGHLVAGNIMIEMQTRYLEYAFYTRDTEGYIVGIKLEAVGYTPDNLFFFHTQDTQLFHVRIDGKDAYLHSVSVLGAGRYLGAFVVSKDRIYVTKSTQIEIYGTFVNHLYLNVFVIFDGFWNQYRLPWIVHDHSSVYNRTDRPSRSPTQKPTKWPTPQTAEPTEKPSKYPTYKPTQRPTYRPTNRPTYKPSPTYKATKRPTYNPLRRRHLLSEGANYENKDDKHTGINWFDANDECEYEYGTWLASVHSSDEDFLMNGFIGTDDRAWIGLFDFDINSDNGCYYFYGSFNGKENDQNKHNFYRYNCDWKWIDRSWVDYTDWDSESPNHLSGNDCGFIDGVYKRGWQNTYCDRTDYIRKFVCLNPRWHPNQNRKFEVNTNQYVDISGGNIAVVSIGNDNAQEVLCIEAVSLDDQVPFDITVSWIGGPGSINPVTLAVFKAPICKTEVIRMEFDYATSVSKFHPEIVRLPGFECHNEGRTGQMAECYVDQSYIITSHTNFRIGNKHPLLQYVIFASESKVTLVSTQTASYQTLNAFTFDKKYAIKYVDHFANGTYAMNNLRAVVVRPQTAFNDIYEDGGYEMYNGYNLSFYETQIWQSQQPRSYKCFGEGYVPPSHSLPYELIMNAISMTVNVRADLKLTLCDGFVNPREYNQDTQVWYMNDVASQITHWESTGCSIRWGAATYIENGQQEYGGGTAGAVGCDEEQQLSISLRLEYLPRCNSTNSQFYDGCQCNLGKYVCWCVDKLGNKIGGKAMQIPHGIAYEEICVKELNCANTEVVFDPNTNSTVP